MQIFDTKGSRWYENFMSGDWAWKQAVGLLSSTFMITFSLILIPQNIISASIPEANGAMIVPFMMGSDKTTASAATGQVDYWPLYGSIGNIHNNVRRAHGSGLVLIGFLAIPKSKEIQNSCKIYILIPPIVATKTDSGSADFRRFRRQLFHASLATVFSSLKPGMTVPEIALCPDGHFRFIIWELGPYIADYPEQVLITCIVQGWCPRYVFPLSFPNVM